MVSCIDGRTPRPARRSPARSRIGDVAPGPNAFSPAPRSTTQRRSGSAPQARIRSRTPVHIALFSAFSLSGRLSTITGRYHRGARSKPVRTCGHAPCDWLDRSTMRQRRGLQSLESTGRRCLPPCPASVTTTAAAGPIEAGPERGDEVRLSAVLVAHDEARQIADVCETLRSPTRSSSCSIAAPMDSAAIARRYTDRVIEERVADRRTARMAGLTAADRRLDVRDDADERVTRRSPQRFAPPSPGAVSAISKVPVANHVGGRWVRYGWGAITASRRRRASPPRAPRSGATRWSPQAPSSTARRCGSSSR